MVNFILYRGDQFNSNFQYFSGCDIDHSLFLEKAGKKYLFVPKMNAEIARKEFNGTIIAYTDLLKELKPFLRGKTGFDARSMPAGIYLKLRKLCSLADISEQLLLARMKKTKKEVDCVRKAAEISRKIFNELDFSQLKTELDVKRYLLASTIEQGVESAFDPIVATDKNASFPHYTPGNVKLGNLVLIDYAVKYKHYCSDLTRCFFLKKDRKKEKAYATVEQIFHEIIDELPDLRTGKQVALLSEKLFKKHGMPPLIHAIGHGVGLDVHEFPRLSRKFNDNLKNSIIALEPAAYFKDFGVRFEETIYFDGRKARIL